MVMALFWLLSVMFVGNWNRSLSGGIGVVLGIGEESGWAERVMLATKALHRVIGRCEPRRSVDGLIGMRHLGRRS
jgi:hypothetical protein